MKKLADSKWSDRFLRKNSIEDALADYTRLMDEAAQSFQVGLVLSCTHLVLIVTMQLATLIDLHYTIGTLSRKNTSAENIEIRETAQSCIEAPPPYKKKQTQDSNVQELEVAGSSVTTIIDVPELTRSPTELSSSPQCEEPIAEIATDGIRDTLNDHYLPEELSSLTLDSDHGVPLKGLCASSHLTYFQFRRYHQSEIILRGRSCIKEGWWAGGMEVQVQGQPALIKKYDDPKAQSHRVSNFSSRNQHCC